MRANFLEVKGKHALLLRVSRKSLSVGSPMRRNEKEVSAELDYPAQARTLISSVPGAGAPLACIAKMVRTDGS